jgi:hypothetical protein
MCKPLDKCSAARLHAKYLTDGLQMMSSNAVMLDDVPPDSRSTLEDGEVRGYITWRTPWGEDDETTASFRQSCSGSQHGVARVVPEETA